MTIAPPSFRQYRPTRPARSRMTILDTPPLSNSSEALGLYFVAAPFTAADRWNGCGVFRSTDQAVSWVTVPPGIARETTMGFAGTALPDWLGGHQLDVSSVVRVELVDSSTTLTSCTVEQLFQGANPCYLAGELMQFLTAELITGKTYDLRGFLRGLQGTERFMSTHAVGDLFILLQPNAVLDLPVSATLLGSTIFYGGVTFGGVIADIVPQAVVFGGNRARPLSPVQAGAYQETTDDIIISWVRRARLNNYWADYSDVPLDETVESYRVDIMNGSSVMRSLSSGTPTVTYTAAEQTTDWGAPVSSLDANIYQLSSVVGDGSPNAFSWAA